MKDFLKNLKLNEANVSMLLGIVVVIIVGGLLVNYFRSVNKTGSTSSTSTTAEVTPGVTPKPVLADLPTAYTVQAGDSLWSIAQSVYTSGYNWTDIYNANKAAIGVNPSNLFVGTKLDLPKVEPKVLTAAAPKTVKYTVVKGDYLSKIAFNTCDNAYLWTSIATDNNIKNANIIEVGQVLTVNCK